MRYSPLETISPNTNIYIFLICTSSTTRKHIFTRHLLCFDSDGLFLEIVGSNNISSCLLKKYGRWTGGLAGRRADGLVDRWADGQCGQTGRWTGGQADTLIKLQL